jgi:hypothetical protein
MKDFYTDRKIWTEPNRFVEMREYEDPQNVHIVPETWREERKATQQRRKSDRSPVGLIAGLQWVFRVYLYFFAVLGFCWFATWVKAMIVFWVN